MNRTPLRVLLAEPHDDARGMYGEYCRQRNVSLEEARDGREALAKALAQAYDVIVIEVRLPGISGDDLIGLLRRDPSTSGTPILAVTTDSCPILADRVRRAGADGVLVKPCLPHALLLEIRRLLRRWTATSQTPMVRIDPDPVRPRPLSRQFSRHETTHPPTPPPTLICPACDRPLAYQRTQIGGVNEHHTEQWDYFECPTGCGAFQYRQRNRRLRKVS